MHPSRPISWLPLASVLAVAMAGLLILASGVISDQTGQIPLPDQHGSTIETLADPHASFTWPEVTATSENKFTLSLVSLLANNSAGDVINFDAAIDSAYTIATTTGGTWSLALANSNRDLQLNFTAAAISEPSTYAALCGALALSLAAYRKRRHS